MLASQCLPLVCKPRAQNQRKHFPRALLRLSRQVRISNCVSRSWNTTALLLAQCNKKVVCAQGSQQKHGPPASTASTHCLGSQLRNKGSSQHQTASRCCRAESGLLSPLLPFQSLHIFSLPSASFYTWGVWETIPRWLTPDVSKEHKLISLTPTNIHCQFWSFLLPLTLSICLTVKPAAAVSLCSVAEEESQSFFQYSY